MLDSATTPTAAPAPAATAADIRDLQTNSQMHVGVHTENFGAVEIHTVIQQSQVGITVHNDRDIARWFSSEVPGLESQLNNSHLNLTGVNFDHGHSGIETATGFQQGQQRQQFSQPQGARTAAASGPPAADPDTPVETATGIVPNVTGDPWSNRVSVSILA